MTCGDCPHNKSIPLFTKVRGIDREKTVFNKRYCTHPEQKANIPVIVRDMIYDDSTRKRCYGKCPKGDS